MERYVHRITMIETPAIVNGALSENAHWKLLFERIKEKSLHLPGVCQSPRVPSVIPNVRRCANQSSFAQWSFGYLRFGLSLHQRICNLGIGTCHLSSSFADFVLGDGQPAF
jgi:hypothetical protein